MKLLYCPKCCDVRKLMMYSSDLTVCRCEASWGYYTDENNAVYCGDAVMLGIANSSLHDAIEINKRVPPGRDRGGHQFTAFIIPESAPTVKREGDKNAE